MNLVLAYQRSGPNTSGTASSTGAPDGAIRIVRNGVPDGGAAPRTVAAVILVPSRPPRRFGAVRDNEHGPVT